MRIIQSLTLFGLLGVFGTCELVSQETDRFRGKDLQKRDFGGQFLEGADFSDAKCFLASFREAKLARAKFRDAGLESVSFSYSDLREADFRGANLNSASLQNADLSKANLAGADMSGVSLQNATLRGANLSKTKGIVDGTRADFRDADLRGANLLDMKDYGGSTARFTNAKYDQHTRWPRGFDVENSGAVLTATESPVVVAPPTIAPPVGPMRRSNDVAAAIPTTPATPSDPNAPPIATIKAMLEKDMWGPSPQGGTKHTYQYKSLKVAPARVGNFRTDGTPANRQTMVYPVKVQVLIQKEFRDGTTRQESKDQTYVFFADEFGDWTYRFSQNN